MRNPYRAKLTEDITAVQKDIFFIDEAIQWQPSGYFIPQVHMMEVSEDLPLRKLFMLDRKIVHGNRRVVTSRVGQVALPCMVRSFDESWSEGMPVSGLVRLPVVSTIKDRHVDIEVTFDSSLADHLSEQQFALTAISHAVDTYLRTS